MLGALVENAVAVAMPHPVVRSLQHRSAEADEFAVSFITVRVRELGDDLSRVTDDEQITCSMCQRLPGAGIVTKSPSPGMFSIFPK